MSDDLNFSRIRFPMLHALLVAAPTALLQQRPTWNAGLPELLVGALNRICDESQSLLGYRAAIVARERSPMDWLFDVAPRGRWSETRARELELGVVVPVDQDLLCEPTARSAGFTWEFRIGSRETPNLHLRPWGNATFHYADPTKDEKSIVFDLLKNVERTLYREPTLSVHQDARGHLDISASFASDHDNERLSARLRSFEEVLRVRFAALDFKLAVDGRPLSHSNEQPPLDLARFDFGRELRLIR